VLFACYAFLLIDCACCRILRSAMGLARTTINDGGSAKYLVRNAISAVANPTYHFAKRVEHVVKTQW
jgi:hypothetical protein